MLEGSTNNQDWLDFVSLAAGNFQIHEDNNLDNYKFHFLDNFTRRSGLIDSFDCGTYEQRVQVVARFLETDIPCDASLADPLVIQTHQILLNIKEVVTVKPRNSVVELEWSTVLEQTCTQFFSPRNLRKFLALYWHIWHPNVNFVHRPTFEPAKAKSILVAAMALIGASVSPNEADNEQAKMWFNCVEEMIFTDDDFCNDSPDGQSTPGLDPSGNFSKIQALQAAYMMARDFGIMSARHPDCLHESFDWKGFAAREQLIRIFLWIYLLDHAFVIFNNLPPRMVIKEMTMHLASPEAAFQAISSGECFRELYTWQSRSALIHSITFREVVESFCRSSITGATQQCFADLGPLNLFAVVSAFHALIFQHQNSFGGNDQLQAVYNALSNWKSVWETYSDEFSLSPPHVMVDKHDVAPDDLWRRVGFMRHSPEYWLLAKLLVDRLSSPMITLPSSSDEPILTRYDQTSGGVVLETGPNVTNVTKGDKVLLSFSSCGTCPGCASDHPAYCYKFNLYNFGGKRPDGSAAMFTMKDGQKQPVHSTFFGQSSFARYTIVHRTSLVKVPQETPLELFAPLGCGIQTGVGAIFNTLDVKPGSSVAVYGVGSVGLAAVMAAKARGAGTIIAIDLQQSRLDLAKELGATHGVLGPDPRNIVKGILEICPPIGVNFAVDCTGVPTIIETMVAALGMRGRAATVGAPGGRAKAKIDIMGHLTYGKEYVGCSEGDSNPPVLIPELIKMHSRGALPLEKLIKYYGIHDYENAMKGMESGKVIKPVLLWK
ncbi:c2h2 transcription factor [Fusarium flagelliforme]|uniref:C2h2 transcription factor n=1 Tax=Fusarium flagelliforme TaxID=2675880 RepID=A0A395MB49_9HYPO|nr:c2h2 transcription factor [Fusarium flagelliforme]